MESEGVGKIFGRSIEKYNLRYSPFVGDGDSKSYSEVVALAPYTGKKMIYQAGLLLVN